jgi:hypothetical protein
MGNFFAICIKKAYNFIASKGRTLKKLGAVRPVPETEGAYMFADYTEKWEDDLWHPSHTFPPLEQTISDESFSRVLRRIQQSSLGSGYEYESLTCDPQPSSTIDPEKSIPTEKTMSNPQYDLRMQRLQSRDIDMQSHVDYDLYGLMRDELDPALFSEGFTFLFDFQTEVPEVKPAPQMPVFF